MNGEKRPPYAYMIQEALLSKGGRSLSKILISEYILSKYPCLIHDDDHTTLLNQTLQDLTQRKILSVVIDVEDQSRHHYILENEIYYENTGAERPTTAPHLRPSNYPQAVAQHPQGRKEGENGIRIKKRTRKPAWASYRSRRKSKIRSIREIMRIDEEEKGGVLQKVLKNVLDEEAEKGVVQKVLKNVLEARVAAVVAQVARGIERQRIVEQVIKRIQGMVLEVSESIVEIAAAAVAAEAATAAAAAVAAEAAEAATAAAAAVAAEAATAAAAAVAAEAATADHDKVALENTEDHQNDDD